MSGCHVKTAERSQPQSSAGEISDQYCESYPIDVERREPRALRTFTYLIFTFPADRWVWLSMSFVI